MYVFICVRVCVCPRVGICDVSGHAQKTEEDIGFLGEGIRDIGGGWGDQASYLDVGSELWSSLL